LPNFLKPACLFGQPDEMWDWIKSCEEKYGKKPDDLTINFMKD